MTEGPLAAPVAPAGPELSFGPSGMKGLASPSVEGCRSGTVSGGVLASGVRVPSRTLLCASGCDGAGLGFGLVCGDWIQGIGGAVGSSVAAGGPTNFWVYSQYAPPACSSTATTPAAHIQAGIFLRGSLSARAWTTPPPPPAALMIMTLPFRLLLPLARSF